MILDHVNELNNHGQDTQTYSMAKINRDTVNVSHNYLYTVHIIYIYFLHSCHHVTVLLISKCKYIRNGSLYSVTSLSQQGGRDTMICIAL